MSKIHHQTTKKFEALLAEFNVTATLEINPVTGNPELTYDDRKFEAESAKDLVEALRAELEDDEDFTGDHLEDLEIEQADDEEDEEKVTGSMVPPKYKAKYAQFGDTCGDDLAAILQGACFPNETWNEDAFLAICAENGVDGNKWRGNNGQRKMCLSNILRARLRKGIDIVILGSVVAGTPQKKAE